ncbi:MAG: zinc-binding dehydrogenase [Verrucomicrobiaceae bacterium]|nr:zinc-binding dehydrogenase [Verrucomicrobiaceae bacterium]
MSSLCLQFDEVGPPARVLHLAQHPQPKLGPHDVRVTMRYAPINPADLNFIEGHYGRIPHPPCIPGHEGAGEVSAIGSAVESLSVGDLVIPMLGAGCWTQEMTAAEQFFARLPTHIDPVQASMLRINPPTASLLLSEYESLEEGDWIMQNAANSGVGRALIQIAAKRGIKTLNFVRRAELGDELIALGATAVFTDDDEGHEKARALLGDTPCRLAANAVGAESAIRLMDLLATGGTMVTYGAMSRRSLKVPNKFLIFKNLSLQGLWVTKWFEKAGHSGMAELLQPLAEMMNEKELLIQVQEIVPLSDFQRAIELASKDSRSGKIILDLASA